MAMQFFQKCDDCGQFAWEYKQKPAVPATVMGENIIHNDEIETGEPLHCQNCRVFQPTGPIVMQI